MSTSGLLAAYAASYAGTVFDWPAANCCHFAAGWVKQMTGRDPMDGLPVTRNAFGARRLILRLGGSMQSAWARQMGADPINPKMAHVGDIVLFDIDPSDPASGVVGVCAGRTSVVALADGVIAHVPTLEAVAAWRVA
jgi:hypothetical protein